MAVKLVTHIVDPPVLVTPTLLAKIPLIALCSFDLYKIHFYYLVAQNSQCNSIIQVKKDKVETVCEIHEHQHCDSVANY